VSRTSVLKAPEHPGAFLFTPQMPPKRKPCYTDDKVVFRRFGRGMLTKTQGAVFATIVGAFTASVVAILVALEPYFVRVCAQAGTQ